MSDSWRTRPGEGRTPAERLPDAIYCHEQYIDVGHNITCGVEPLGPFTEVKYVRDDAPFAGMDRLKRAYYLVRRVRKAHVARRRALAEELAECGYASIHDTKNGHLIYYRSDLGSFNGWGLCGAVDESAHKPIQNLDLGRRIRAAELRESSRAALESDLFDRMSQTAARHMTIRFTNWLEDE